MVFIKVYLSAIIVIAITETANICYHPCTRDFRPVCGYDGQEFKTFMNKCLFDITNCERHYKMTIVDDTLCEKQTKDVCNKICTLDYNPVCGSDEHKSTTYGNMCSFEIANCESNYKLRLTRTGECLEKENTLKEINNVICIRPCPAIYLPVCGFDGETYKTFANKCQYDVINCESHNHIRFIKMGEC